MLEKDRNFGGLKVYLDGGRWEAEHLSFSCLRLQTKDTAVWANFVHPNNNELGLVSYIFYVFTAKHNHYRYLNTNLKVNFDHISI